MRPSSEDLRAPLAEVLQAQEEPFGSRSILLQYFVMQQARAPSALVLLDGQGVHETLLGYPRYVAAYLASQWRSSGLTGLLNGAKAPGSNNASWSLPRMLIYLVASRLAGFRFRHRSSENRHLNQITPLPTHVRQFSDACFDKFEVQRLLMERTNWSMLLRFGDKNALAHSVRTQLPFLDRRLAEFAMSLPGSLKIGYGWSGWLLWSCMTGRTPQESAWQRDKLVFEPIRTWQARLLPEMKTMVVRSTFLGKLAHTHRLNLRHESLSLRKQWHHYSAPWWEQGLGVSGWGDEAQGTSAGSTT